MDKKCIDMERKFELEGVKRNGVERQAELQKKQLDEKIHGLKEMLNAEKETRDMWIERYTKEQDELTAVKGELLTARSDWKDAQLEITNLQMQLKTN